MSIRRLALAIVCACGVTCVPALAAPLSVDSAALTTFRTCTLSPVTVGSTVGSDTTVDQNTPTANLGTLTTLTVTSRNSRNARLYLKFDITRCSPVITEQAKISSASLRLVATALASACRTLDVFRVASAWTETAATWNNQPFGTAVNNPPSASRTAAMDLGAAPCQNSTVNQYVSGWDVTTDVRAFVAGTTNNGWMIRDDVENSGGTARSSTFVSNNAASVGAPQLIIDYS